MNINQLLDLVSKVYSGRANTQECATLLEWVERNCTLPQSHESLTEQLFKAIGLASRHGLYDAADAIVDCFHLR